DAIRSPERWVWRTAFRIATGEMGRRREESEVQANDEYEVAPEATELLGALRRLPAKQRASVVLHYHAGYSLKEVAQIIGPRPPPSGCTSIGAGRPSGKNSPHEVDDKERCERDASGDERHGCKGERGRRRDWSSSARVMVHVPEDVLPQPVREPGADYGECKGYPGQPYRGRVSASMGPRDGGPGDYDRDA